MGAENVAPIGIRSSDRPALAHNARSIMT